MPPATPRHALRVPRPEAEAARILLEERGMLDRSWRPQVDDDHVSWPLTEAPQGPAPCGAWVVLSEAPEPAPPPIDPHTRLRKGIEAWLGDGTTEEERERLLDDVPSKWERLGDLVLLPEGAFSGPDWTKAIDARGGAPWAEVASALKVERLGRQAPVADDGHRSSQATMLLGTKGDVDVLDHGVRFRFDATRQMFSSGNVTERHRMGDFDLHGETVVDAFAGVGYYTLPMLVRGGAAHVHACEWNPEAAAWLQRGAAANAVDDRLTLHVGDNRSTLPTLAGLADRVVLGLLPSSEAAWDLARACLKPTGGWLHVHMNVEEERIEAWSAATAARLGGRVAHVERVKWYAPRIRHVVLDVKVA